MPINKKYHPDYRALYPGVDISDEVIKALRESDRKIEYMEYELTTFSILLADTITLYRTILNIYAFVASCLSTGYFQTRNIRKNIQ